MKEKKEKGQNLFIYKIQNDQFLSANEQVVIEKVLTMSRVQ